MGSLNGFMYKYLKSMVLNLFGSENLKRMLPVVEQVAVGKLQQWLCQDTIEMKEATTTVIDFSLIVLILLLD